MKLNGTIQPAKPERDSWKFSGIVRFFRFPRAGINGTTGEVYGFLKSFRVPDPANSDRLIQYSAIEGPEAAIYTRGTARLESGKAMVTLPPHFAAMAAPDTLSVTLTPRSRQSLGLAAVNISFDFFEVEELLSGVGTYDFDYVIYAVRKGFEDYQVYRDSVRPADEAQATLPAAPGDTGRKLMDALGEQVPAMQ